MAQTPTPQRTRLRTAARRPKQDASDIATVTLNHPREAEKIDRNFTRPSYPPNSRHDKLLWVSGIVARHNKCLVLNWSLRSRRRQLMTKSWLASTPRLPNRSITGEVLSNDYTPGLLLATCQRSNRISGKVSAVENFADFCTFQISAAAPSTPLSAERSPLFGASTISGHTQRLSTFSR